MNKNTKILLMVSLWFLALIITCFIGISNVFASEYSFTYNDTQTYYDNYGSYLTAVGETWNGSLNAYVSNAFRTAPGYYGGGVVINSPIPIIQNHTYSMTFQFDNVYNLALSIKNYIAIGNSISSAGSNYSNGSYNAYTIQSKTLSGNAIQFVFKANNSASYIFIPWTTNVNVSQSYVMTKLIIDDLGSEGVSETTINNSLNNQTNNINSNSNNNRDMILNSQASNTQTIIDNQSSTTQAIIDSNKENFNTCSPSKNLFDKSSNIINNSFIGSTGSIQTDSTLFYQDKFIEVSPNTEYVISSNSSTIYRIAEYNSSKGFIQRVYNQNPSTSYMFRTTSNTKYIKMGGTLKTVIDTLQIEKGSVATSYSSYTETCVNKLDEQTNAINNLNDSINDSDSTGATTEASDFFSSFNTNTFGLTSIITSPLNLIQSLTSSTCSQLHLPLPYLNNKYLDLPCMTSIYQTHFGTFFTMYQTITYGIIAYWVIVRIFNQVKDFKNPEHDEIEVVDL